MGYLGYGGSQEYEFDDHTLAHVKAVLTHRLRRQESFVFSWSAGAAGSTVSLWVTPSIPLTFHFTTDTAIRLSQQRVSDLIRRSYGPAGLVLKRLDDPESDVSA